MYNSQNLVVDVKTGKSLGTVEKIAEKEKKHPAIIFDKLYELNKAGVINFRTKKGKYIHGIKMKIDNKKLKVYNFSVFIHMDKCINTKKLFIYIMLYLFQPIPLILLVSILPTALIVPFNQFIIIFVILILTMFNFLFHELGHYAACCYFQIPCTIQIKGLYNSIFFRTDKNIEIIIVSLAGIIISIFTFIIIIILTFFLDPSFLKGIIVTLSILMLIIYLLILPASVDYQNIRNSLNDLKRGKEPR